MAAPFFFVSASAALVASLPFAAHAINLIRGAAPPNWAFARFAVFAGWSNFSPKTKALAAATALLSPTMAQAGIGEELTLAKRTRCSHIARVGLRWPKPIYTTY
jgi:hypothetical protein